jgi:pectate lyase
MTKMKTLLPIAMASAAVIALAANAQAAPPKSAPDFSLIGYASTAGGTTGGAGGITNSVSTREEFLAAIKASDPRVILVTGPIALGQSRAEIRSHKTIIGVGTNSGFIGGVSIKGASNIVLRNLHFPMPGSAAKDDGLTTSRAHHIWVDHCNFGDCTDGQFDITHGSDFITISWCKFSYTDRSNTHRLSMLIGNRDDTSAEDKGKLNVTLHHNWFGTLVNSRMPRVRYGQVHVFNDYYNDEGTDSLYCIGLGCSAHVLLESSCFEGAKTPWRTQPSSESAGCVPGVIQWNDDNVFEACKVPTELPNSTVFKPSYTYKLDAGKDVKEVVIKNAGVGQGPFASK